MYRDIISYELAENISEEQLLKVANEVHESWMKHQAGFLGWEIHSVKDGSYSDIVYWRSREDAMNAEKEMANIPNGGAWFACYKEGSIQSKNLNLISKIS